MQVKNLLAIVLIPSGLFDNATSFSPSSMNYGRRRSVSSVSLSHNVNTRMKMATIETDSAGNNDGDNAAAEIAAAQAPTTNPMFNGKRILPIKIVQNGLKGSSNVAAVYAVLNSKYKSSSSDSSSSSLWTSYCEHIGTTTDLQQTINEHVSQYGSSESTGSGPGRVSYVRAISFATPNIGAMESIASDWRREVISDPSGNGKTNFDPVLASMDVDDEEYDDDFDDDDDDDDYFEMMAGAIAVSRSGLADARGIDPKAEEEASKSSANDVVVSPFEQYATTAEPGSMVFNKENVDKVLEEIRPYLISDGGNVSVEGVDEEKQDVFLKLEGACGSCPSSTVTMQMGIERVLKENFPNLGQVLQVDSGSSGEKNEFDVVQREVDRIKPAIIAMGGKVDVVSVDKQSGTVKLNFQGAGKLRQGVELALLDIDFVETVEFE